MLRKLITQTTFMIIMLLTGSVSILATVGESRHPDADANRILQRSVDYYRSLATYRDTVILRAVSDVPGIENVTNTDVFRFIYGGSGKFAIISFDGHSIFGNGKTITAHKISSGKYTVNPFETVNWKKNSGFAGKLVPMFHPIAEIMISRSEGKSFPNVKKVLNVADEKYKGKPGKTVYVMADYSATGFPDPIKAALWFNDKTKRLERIYVDIASTMEKLVKSKVRKAFIEVLFTKISENEAIETQAFQFRPRAVDRLVSSFTPKKIEGKDNGTMSYLKGRPAPNIEGFDLNGKRIKLSDFRGKVVLLEFWATWCGACVRSWQYLKMIKANFADADDVVILGVNMDDPGDTAMVKQYLADRNLTLRNFRDAESRISAAFRVLGTPTLAVIDQSGVIRSISSGQGEWMVDRYTKMIKKLRSSE